MNIDDKDTIMKPDASGDYWFRLAMSKYVDYLDKKFEAKDKWGEWEARKKAKKTFDEVKNLESEARKLKEDAEKLEVEAGKLYGACEDCFSRSFEEYNKELYVLRVGQDAGDRLFRRWGDAAYALAVIRRGEYFCDGSKNLFAEAVAQYARLKNRDDKIRRREGNAYYELAAIDMDNSSYGSAGRNFKKAVEVYQDLGKKSDEDYRNWGNALFEQGLIAWRRYTFLKVNTDPVYPESVKSEAEGLVRHRKTEDYGVEERQQGVFELGGFGVCVGEMENSYKEAEGFFKAAEEKYGCIGEKEMKKKEYMDVSRSLGEMYLVYGRRKRYDYLSVRGRIEFLNTNRIEHEAEIKMAQKQYETLFFEAETNFNKAVEYFLDAEKPGNDEEKKAVWAYLGATYYRLFLTYLSMGCAREDDARKARAQAVEFFRKTKAKVLDILVDLSLDISYAIVNDDILFFLLDYVENEDCVFFKNIMNCANSGKEKLSVDTENNYKEIYIRSMYIISRLEVDNQFENVMAHYANKLDSQKMLFEGANFRLNSDYYFNDPQEGKLLHGYLFGGGEEGAKRANGAEAKTPGYATFAGCFSFNYDSLNQFRLYGRERGREGTGLSLVFNKSFFSGQLRQDRAASLGDFEQSVRGSIGDADWKKFMKKFAIHLAEEPKRNTLFRCAYFDPDTDRVDTVGQKERYLFYREEKFEKGRDLGKDYRRYREFIRNIVKSVNNELEKLRKFVEEEKLDADVVTHLVLKLRYLIKHIAFKAEQECRIVKNCRIIDKDKEICVSVGSDKEVSEGDLRVFVNYDMVVSQHVKEIYFGPMATGLNMFKDYLAYRGLGHIKCLKSRNPFVGDSSKEFKAEKE